MIFMQNNYQRCLKKQILIFRKDVIPVRFIGGGGGDGGGDGGGGDGKMV